MVHPTMVKYQPIILPVKQPEGFALYWQHVCDVTRWLTNGSTSLQMTEQLLQQEGAAPGTQVL